MSWQDDDAVSRVDLSQFKTPKQLNITPEEFTALLRAALYLCERGDNPIGPSVTKDKNDKHQFNISWWWEDRETENRGRSRRRESECGTAGCIYGTAFAMAKTAGAPVTAWLSQRVPSGASHALLPLFSPYNYTIPCTPRVAANAVMHFLKTGKYRFDGKAK